MLFLISHSEEHGIEYNQEELYRRVDSRDELLRIWFWTDI
jgi:hypothetical protein